MAKSYCTASFFYSFKKPSDTFLESESNVLVVIYDFRGLECLSSVSFWYKTDQRERETERENQ